MELDNRIKLPFISLKCLLEMKQKAGRQKDLADIEVLKNLNHESS